MIDALAHAVVVLIAIYFVGLGVISLFLPSIGSRFLLGFADTLLKHYLELLVRFVAGGAFILHAPHMMFPGTFGLFGWILLVTTACLLFVPWTWHRRFARTTVPRAIRYVRLIGISSVGLGVFVLVAVVGGPAA